MNAALSITRPLAPRARHVSPRPVFGFLPSAETPDAVVRNLLAPTDHLHLVVTPNLDHVALLRRSPEFRAAYASAGTILCDGLPVAAYARLHAHRTRRVTGCDVAAALMSESRLIPPATRLFFAVDSQETAAAIAAWAVARGLGDRVATLVPPHGFCADPRARDTLATAIAAHRTTLLVMGVGAPRSELFVHRERARLPPCHAICVGQAVKVALGLVRRAPPVARRVGLEWLWRLAAEPTRLGRRYALGGADFLLAVAEDLLDRGRIGLSEER